MRKRPATQPIIDQKRVQNRSEELTSGAHLDLYIEDSNRPKGEAKRHGIQLMSNPDIGEAIQNTAIIGADDNGTIGTSYYEEKRIRLLTRLYKSPSMLFRMFVFGSDAMVRRLDALRTTSPHFTTIIDYVIHAARTSQLTHTPLYLQPMVLVGAPGIGKTFFTECLSSALGVHCARISAPSLTHSGSMSGYGTAWQGAGPGSIAKALLSTRVVCPVVLVDEIDKLGRGPAHEEQIHTFLPLLEQETSCRYTDDYIGVPMRADSILWVLTANDVSELPEPFLDRLIIFDLKNPNIEQRRDIVVQMFDLVNLKYGNRLEALNASSLAALSALNIRSAKKAIDLAVIYAIAQKRAGVTLPDIDAALAVVGRTMRIKSFGFVTYD